MSDSENKTSIDDLVDQTIRHLDANDPSSPEYTAAVNNLKTLESIKPKKLKDRLDPNVVVSAVSSLGGIAMVLKYEKVGVIASKAFSLVPKLRIF